VNGDHTLSAVSLTLGRLVSDLPGAVALAVSVALCLSVVPAWASDCNEPTDCAAAAVTARNPLLPIAGAGVGAAAGAVVRTIRKPGKGGEQEHGEQALQSPCQAELESLLAARGVARALMKALQQQRDYLAYLDQLYEINRFKGFMSAGIDLAFLRQSIMGSSPKGGVVNAVVFAALKGILKEELKQAVGVIWVGDQSFDVGKFAEKGVSDAEKKAFLTAMKQALTRQAVGYAQRALYIEGVTDALPKGLDPQGPVGRAVERALRTQWAEKLASNAVKFVDVAISTYKAGAGMQASMDMLAEIRKLMGEVRDGIFELENALEFDAAPAVELALSSLRGCMNSWVDRHGAKWMERWELWHGRASLDAMLGSGIGRHLAGPGAG
jgi:hypothetical protein